LIDLPKKINSAIKLLIGSKNMETLEEIKNILAKHKEELKQKYKVKEIGIFGSCGKLTISIFW